MDDLENRKAFLRYYRMPEETTTTTTVVACTLNSRPLSGHLGVITVGDFFSPSTMVRWVCNSRDPVLCATVLLLHNVFRKSEHNFLRGLGRVCTMNDSRVIVLVSVLKRLLRVESSVYLRLFLIAFRETNEPKLERVLQFPRIQMQFYLSSRFSR